MKNVSFTTLGFSHYLLTSVLLLYKGLFLFFFFGFSQLSMGISLLPLQPSSQATRLVRCQAFMGSCL
ncbi:hypothetical protein BDV37DRAFT_233169 [Aspergillus pseudonomiae]|uniref:Uncharacterized protein n=1 Tax=Aspergillus pseudonomiae TaxID=1506151 RepID=A0A5N7D0H9_9EURO|nr:uncharacterized protein BDV37DRAFT_233169 [Aspergillus pseudonomiae]KAE8399383.1 hypothetical protein BDV37DRAFT_233169 [Aspergillus pseudonomiae]